MGAFKELDPDLVRKVLEGHEDLLATEAKKEQAVFRNTACMGCGAYELQQVINVRRPFTPGSPLPNKILRCSRCQAEFDPYSRIIISAGKG